MSIYLRVAIMHIGINSMMLIINYGIWLNQLRKKQRTLGSSSESDCELHTALEEMNSTSVPSQSSWKTEVSKLVVSILWSDCWTANFH